MLLASRQTRPAPAAVTVAREPWPDAAKGVLILLVVLWHTTRKHYALLPWVPPPVAAAWEAANLVLQPVRVPLFFALSGLLAARSVHRPWRAVLRARVLNGYWTYLVWMLLGAAFFTVGPALVTSTARSPGELVEAALLGGANVWYLYALAAYFVVARTVARLPTWLPVLGAAALAVVADLPAFPGDGHNRDAVVRNLVFFLLPALRPDLLRALVARARWRTALPATAAFLATAGLLVAQDTARAGAVRLPLGALGVVVGLLLAVCVARSRPAAAALLGRLGRTTLPVYVLHLPLLALLHAAALALPAPTGVGTTALAVAYPLLATAGLTAAALAVHRVLLVLGLGALFRLPDSLPIMTRTRATG